MNRCRLSVWPSASSSHWGQKSTTETPINFRFGGNILLARLTDISIYGQKDQRSKSHSLVDISHRRPVVIDKYEVINSLQPLANRSLTNINLNNSPRQSDITDIVTVNTAADLPGSFLQCLTFIYILRARNADL